MTGLADAFDRIGSFLEQRMPLLHAPGAALAVTDREELLGVVVRGFADVAARVPVRPETRFEIGSISKSFAAIVALQEAEAGRLDLHAPISEVLPWPEIDQPLGPITPHHLLTHTSGLAIGTEESPTGPGALWILQRVPPTFAPGERFHYSNDGYKLVGAILERLTGRSVPDLLRERILEPLGMASTEGRIAHETRRDLAVGYATLFDDRPAQRHHELVPAPWTVSQTADGSIVSTVVDMAAYARLLLNRGATAGGDRVLSEEAFSALTSPFAAEPEEEREVPGHYGYGLSIGAREDRPILTHSGGMVGYTALLVVEPVDGIGCVMLLNGHGDRLRTVGYALDAVRAAIRGDVLPEVAPPSDPAAIVDAADYAGTYRGVDRDVRVEARDGGLVLVDGDVGAVLEREPLVDGRRHDRFLVAHEALDRYELRFERDGDGRVAAIVHGPARFTRDGRLERPRAGRWHGLDGLFRSNDPWEPALRVYARGDRLFLWSSSEEEEWELTELPDGWFAAGDPALPRRLRFHAGADGDAVVVEFNGGRWYRAADD